MRDVSFVIGSDSGFAEANPIARTAAGIRIESINSVSAKLRSRKLQRTAFKQLRKDALGQRQSPPVLREGGDGIPQVTGVAKTQGPAGADPAPSHRSGWGDLLSAYDCQPQRRARASDMIRQSRMEFNRAAKIR